MKTTALLAITLLLLGTAFDARADDRLREALFGYEHNLSKILPMPTAKKRRILGSRRAG